MFIIVNRHKEILHRDGDFYPADALVILTSPWLFATEGDADRHRATIREYTRLVPVEASL